MSAQKARDAILAVTVFGALLLLPPVLPFFDRTVSVLGMPLIVVYVFGVWIALIVAAWALSRRLPELPRAGPAGRDAMRPAPSELNPADEAGAGSPPSSAPPYSAPPYSPPPRAG